MGCVYLLGDYEKDGVYKIGVTRGSVEKRIKALQTGNSGEIYLVKSFETNHPFLMEDLLHKRFTQSKVSGEWYCLTEEERKSFESTCKELQSMMDALENNYYFKKKYGKKDGNF